MTLAAYLLAASMLTTSDAAVPAGATATSPPQSWVINGVPTRIREWLLEMDVAQSADFYRRQLGARCIQLESAGGLIIAGPVAGAFVTVELMRAGPRRTRARISEAQVGKPAIAPEPLALPGGSRVLNRMSSGEGPDVSQVLLAQTGDALNSTADFFRDSLTRRGMRLIERRSVRHASHAAQLLSFAGRRSGIELVLTADGARTWISVVSHGEQP